MKTKLIIVLCSAVILLSGCATSHLHDAAWEYKIVEGYATIDIENKMNTLAQEGWVVVSSSYSPSGDPNTPKVVVILKRRK